MKYILFLTSFSLVFFSCQKEPHVNLNPPPTPVAVFTFPGSPNACTVATPGGPYFAGTALSASNTVTVQVNVTTAGTYTISTATVNGYKFSASGTFTTTGTQTVSLVGTGTPITAETDSFTPSATGITGCTFNVTVSAPVPAVFTFSGAPGACTVANVNGNYGLGTALTGSNTVTVQVNVTTAGTYTITTNTVGGMTFSKSGAFTATGVQTVTLIGTGTPTTAGANNFTVGTNGCTFSVTVTGPAVYTFSGEPGACTVATVNGTYGVGIALSASNTVTVQVNVTTIGTYTITTNTVGGMTFSKSGSFTATGIQTVILSGAGTPATSGANNFTVGTNGCTFSVTVIGPAVYTFSGAPGACTVATINGSYGVGVALTASNTVTVQVNVTTIGTYTITTNTVGGMTFSKSGAFTATGIQTVILSGAGNPTISGANNFTVGTNGCTFSVTVAGPAVYTLSGAPGACTLATVAGTYTAGSILTASNTVTVQVNVAAIGSYTITTNTAGGMTFSKSGSFTATGIQTVILNGVGTPTTAGANNFTVGTNGCTFSITVTAPSGTYSCKIDGVFTSFSDRAQADITDDFFIPPTPYLYLDGYTGPPNGGFVPELQIFITKNDNSTVTAGTYNVDGILLPNGYRIEIDLHLENPDGSVTIWNTSSTLFPPPNPPFTIIVTSVSGGRAKGTFSGTLTNTLAGSTLFKQITEGTFDLPIL
jgi:hypothetical protein